MLSITLCHGETGAVAKAEDQAKIEDLRARIKRIETQIEGAQTKTEKLQKELRENEVVTAQTLTSLHDVQLQIKQKHAELEGLRLEQLKHEKVFNREREQLVRQIRAAYKINRNNYIKLILNQEDPVRIGRALAYYDYYNQLQSRRINQARKTLQSVDNIQQVINVETDGLEKLQVEYENKLDEFHGYRASRHDIIARLQTYIKEQGFELRTLREDEKKLSNLFSNLKENRSQAVKTYEGALPFASLKGRLKWPVNGKLLNRFGRRKKGANLKWQGVLIGAKPGTSVNAVGVGKVVFSDWFSNLGLLIIIDHGDGYMSLYGHNQSLLKSAGDIVLAGETIATVGDTGGQNNASLYFEIRHGVEPLNPIHWCKG